LKTAAIEFFQFGRRETAGFGLEVGGKVFFPGFGLEFGDPEGFVQRAEEAEGARLRSGVERNGGKGVLISGKVEISAEDIGERQEAVIVAV